MERLRVVNLDEIAYRWQIPVERVKYFITDCGMDPRKSAQWVEDHKDLFLEEKRIAFEDSLFPRHLRPEPAESPA